MFTTSSNFLTNVNGSVESSSAINDGSSVLTAIVGDGTKGGLWDAIYSFIEPFVDIADGVSTLLGLIA
ncbi:hypothetical protein [Corynebacterium sanguinis]|uniref:Porin n=1 Tax=Corynebacterium sanguinis TaxID=2594913 RepID=A0A6C1TUR2_9CORY|nr:hypothetical protein [Corynebacterium sanguinis]TVS26502.1 hypothetical protein EKI59_10510 [Corynebacterium sanguinis]